MKDLDFDELDRAVNSLMSNVPKSAPQTTTTNEKTLDLGSSLSGDSEAIPAKLENMAKKAAEQDAPAAPASPAQMPSPSVVATPRPAAPAIKAPDRPQSSAPAIRRGGRFMDVVHPSSDMKKPESPRPVSRQGVTIEPMGKAAPGEPVVQAKPFAPAPIMPEAETKPADEPEMGDEALKPLEPPKIETTPKPVDTPEPATSSSDWPDPLDMAAKNETTPPLTSPFLADAKVEKRPLGGLSTPEAGEETKPEPQDVATETDTKPEIVEPTLPQPEETEPTSEPEVPGPAETPVKVPKLPGDEDMTAPLPEELRGDLMAVEADTTHDEMKQQHDIELEKEQPSDKSKEAAVKDAPKPEVKSESPASTGPTSIPQQYQEEPSTGDQDNGAIYDTSTYHQPLAHPAKKKSGWMWVIWIVVILLLGAAGGAAIYFMKLV